jgi:hypothetical protein
MRFPVELRPYQQRIATHLYEHDQALCVLRPGGGKTIAALTAIRDLLDQKVIRHALVIAPKRVARTVWPDEIDAWAHTAGLDYAVLDGHPTDRAAQLRLARVRDLTIIGIDLMQWLVEKLGQFTEEESHPIWDLLVIDEVSRLRNPTGERAKALARIIKHWRMVWGLTGTLRPSSALDLFMPARIVTGGKLWGRSFYQWRRANFYPVDYKGYNWTPLPGAEDRLNADIAPWITTAAEGELVQGEPTIILDRVTLPPDARAKYHSMEHQLLAQIEGSTVVANSAAVATGKLAQMANGFMYDGDEVYGVHLEKSDWLRDVIENATGPTLLIYEYIEDLKMCMRLIDPNLPYLGAGIGKAETQKNIEDWNAGKLPFMALHPASGGHGLNLQHGGADMAWISPTWSPEYWEQTIARLNRSGQTRQVMVRVCIADNTVDEMKLNRVYGKMDAQAAFEAYLRSVSSEQALA